MKNHLIALAALPLLACETPVLKERPAASEPTEVQADPCQDPAQRARIHSVLNRHFDLVDCKEDMGLAPTGGLSSPVEACFQRESATTVTNVGLLTGQCAWVVNNDPKKQVGFSYDTRAHEENFRTPDAFVAGVEDLAARATKRTR